MYYLFKCNYKFSLLIIYVYIYIYIYFLISYVGRKCWIGGSVNAGIFLIHLFFYCMAAFSDCGAIPKNLSLLESKEKYSEFGRVLKCRIFVIIIYYL